MRSVSEQEYLPTNGTPGLSHTRFLSWLDATGLPPWLLGISCFIMMTVLAVVLLIVERVPDPDFYRNAIAFIAIISFFLGFYFRMGRGWYEDVLKFLDFDRNLEAALGLMEPRRRIVRFELGAAALSALVNVIFTGFDFTDRALLGATVTFFYFLQYALIIFCIDITFRQLAELTQIAKSIRIDMMETEFYSTLANAMLRFFGLYIFGLCVITMSFLVFTEGEAGFTDMLVIMMPWYLPGLVLMSLYMVPYHLFRKRIRMMKRQELNRISRALRGNPELLQDSMLARDVDRLTTVDLLYYQERVQRIREWPFTDRIRSLVLFGILPPLTWVIAAYIEILIEGGF